jgi:signal transduction histidine kinase
MPLTAPRSVTAPIERQERALSTHTRESGKAREWSLRSWMLTAGAIAATVAIAALVAGTVAIVGLASARKAVVERLDPALLNTQALLGSLLNQETAVRGYVITGDPIFLEPDEKGRSQQQAAIARLRGLAGGSVWPELSASLDTVEDRVGAWRAQYADPTIAAVRDRGARSANVDPTGGKAEFDAVRAAVDAQRNQLVAARRAGLETFATAVSRLTITAVAIAASVVVLLGALAVWVSRTIGRPIERLAASVRDVAEGDFEHRVVGSGPKEIVELGQDVESMRARILVDLQASRALVSQLNKQTDELGRSNRDLEQFAYVASHDLQEPLRKVSGFCELLRTRYRGQLDERADQYIDFAVDGARRMSRLIADLLAFSRVGRSTPARQELQGQALVDQALRNLTTQIGETGAEVTHDPLPTVRGEAALLITVFQNLIGNAVKFHGEQPPRIHIGVTERVGHWEFRISDNGIGIEPAYAEKVFVIFQRLHAKEEYPGTGIGLALCRKILEYHDGTIWLDPEQTEGTAFCFTLPVLAAADEKPDPATTGAAVIGAAGPV